MNDSFAQKSAGGRDAALDVISREIEEAAKEWVEDYFSTSDEELYRRGDHTWALMISSISDEIASRVSSHTKR